METFEKMLESVRIDINSPKKLSVGALSLIMTSWTWAIKWTTWALYTMWMMLSLCTWWWMSWGKRSMSQYSATIPREPSTQLFFSSLRTHSGQFAQTIVCIDSTHEIISHGFKLITALVTDDYGEGEDHSIYIFSTCVTDITYTWLYHLLQWQHVRQPVAWCILTGKTHQ